MTITADIKTITVGSEQLLETDDTLEVQVKNESDTADIEVVDLNFISRKL